MLTISTDDPRAAAGVDAIHTGNLERMRQLLRDHPELATARLGKQGDAAAPTRSLLHVVTDWPGHFPNGAAMVALLVGAGADVNARFTGPHTETPLHWAASSDDVEVLDALLDAGADIEADGAVIAGGTPLMDAVAFGQWKAAARLVERGARTTLWQAAALGLMDRVIPHVERNPPPDSDELSSAFWAACHGGQQSVASYLLDRGAELNWLPGWEARTPLDAARRTGAYDVIRWLHSKGAKMAEQLGTCR